MTTGRAILLDIEGTTTPIAFVKDVLFPFARSNAASFLAAHRQEPEVQADLALLAEERRRENDYQDGAPPGESGDPLAFLFWLMDRDRKSTALKALQGRIWRDGYQSGALVAEVYPDVAPALVRFRAAGIDVSIFSSGSVLAQRLLFAHTNGGDLRPYLSSYFDTTTGGKKEPASYTRIASELGLAPGQVLFVSDAAEELEAAEQAGMEVALCVRPGTREPTTPRHRVVRSLEEI
ncbi:MAG TPA: acireductone synthase [Thermoanaerobaculia bacterium]|nr:acireductone synthase [Thermoanaerobaculia bacterium]